MSEKKPVVLTPEEQELRFKNIVARFITLATAGDTPSGRQIAKDLGIPERSVQRIINSDKFKAAVTEVGDKAVESAKQQIRAVVNRLAPKAIKALESLLDDDSSKAKAEGVKIYFRMVGLDEAGDDTGNAPIVINLPQGVDPRVVQGEVVKKDDDQV